MDTWGAAGPMQGLADKILNAFGRGRATFDAQGITHQHSIIPVFHPSGPRCLPSEEVLESPPMKTFPRSLSLVLFLSVLPAGRLSAAETPQPADGEGRTIRLLTVGNSFARNATEFLPHVAEAAGHRLILGAANVGGCTLERHWRAAEAFEADPDDAQGRMYRYEQRNASLREILAAEPWDFVTLQQASQSSIDEATFEPFASLLHAYVRRHAPQAQVLVHQTWAYRADSGRLTAWGIDESEMYRRLTRNYRRMAEALGCRIIPVGAAFRRTSQHPDGMFRFPDSDFDYRNAIPPALPDQRHSLHVGWYWQRGRDGGAPRLRFDPHHAGPAGKYLGAAAFFEVLFGELIIGNPFVPEGLTEDDVRFLQERVRETVTAGEPLPPGGEGPGT